MIKNFLKISLRHLLRNRAYTIINISGLTLGVTVCTIIFLIIYKEYSFDKTHLNYQNIYRINRVSENASGKDYSGNTPYPLKEALENDLTEIQQLTRFHFDRENIIKVENKSLYEEENIIFTDTSFYDVFDFGGGILNNVLSGNFKKDMAQPGNVFLTETIAKKYFGAVNPIGKSIKLGNLLDAEIKGIIKDTPELSHFSFSMLVSYNTLTKEYIGGFDMDEFGVVINGFHYFLLPQNMRRYRIEERLAQVVEKYIDEEDLSLIVQPIADIHFNTLYAGDNPGETVDEKQLISLAFIALFIICIASINFINLATAIGIKRAREIGIRKVLGAGKKELVFQHLGEAFLITLFSLLLALGIVERILPYFNQIAAKNLSLDFLENPSLVVFLISLLLVISLLSGIYPAMVLSSYNPAKALKSKFNSMSRTSIILRRGLVIFQFGIAQVLIIEAIVISRQLNYFQEKPLGFEKDAIVNIFMPTPEDSTKRTQFYNQVAQIGNVSSISFNLGAPTSENNISTSFSFPEVDETVEYDVSLKIADFRYKDTYGLTLTAGKWFDEANEESSEIKFVVNEALVKKLGFTNYEEAIGKVINTGLNGINAEIIGVTHDFHLKSLHEEIMPVIIVKFPQFYYNAGIRFNGGSLNSTIKQIQQTWTRLYPAFIFDYSFMDDSINELYKHEQRTFKISQMFAGIAIFIGCLGLLGLSAFMVNQRKKEIGVRKVLGASNNSIIFLFSKEFLKLLMFAFVFAAPISWFFMDNWLTDFAYHISIGADIFIITLLLVGFVALSTVSFQSIRAAFESPIKALKSE